MQASEFEAKDLVGGHIAIDLVNTVTARHAEPVERLENFQRLLYWARLTDEFNDRTLADLGALGRVDPAASDAALERLKIFRESLYDVLTALMDYREPPSRAVIRLEATWKGATEACSWSLIDGHLSPELTVATSGLDYLAHVIAFRSFDLLRAFPVERTRVCAGERCGWLFIDRSRGGKRRWCDMAVCGNTAKTRRYLQRRKQARQRRSAVR